MPPFAPNGFAPGGSGFGPTSASRRPSGNATVNLAVDNMIRNQLKVSDVRDPKQIADALLNYYRDLPVAAAVRQEAQGLPFLQAPAMAALPPPQPTSSDAEFRIADSDVEKALTDLATNPLTNDIVPEMQGWADSIRSAVAQGYTAAGHGLDPTNRDMVFAIRRQLGEYGRMARFVGSLTPGMTFNYRRLGQALDEVSAVLLVMLGESLASVGFASGYYLLQVPLAELQQRRDTVIFALRNFMGGAQQAYGPDDWPRGIDAYRRLYNWLEEQGQGDLRSLLIENEIAQSMDALISRAQNGTAEGLRALGVTAQLDVERFRRMAIVAPGAMSRNGRHHRSPPLEAFLEALELFAETFRPAGGLRLLRIARPPILLYGIYSTNLLEQDQLLISLILLRTRLATILDSLFPASGAGSVEPQVLLDMLLLELDRGIDLLALDASPRETQPKVSTQRAVGPTQRAIAYWLIAQVIKKLITAGYVPFPPPPDTGPISETFSQRELNQISSFYTNDAPGVDKLTLVLAGLPPIPAPSLTNNKQLEDAVLEELRVQWSLEERWQNLVRTVAPEAGNQDQVFGLLKTVIEQANHDAAHLTTTTPLPSLRGEIRQLPRQFEESLDEIVRDQRPRRIPRGNP
jgi:hypothetical protein